MHSVRLAVLVLALLAPAVRARSEAPPAVDLGEETRRIGVTVKDMYGREETRQIPITIFRPAGAGPHPLVIMNHGRAPAERRAQQGRMRYENLSRYLVGKGFVVLLPTRVGYAETFGDFDPEGSGPCNARRLEPMAQAASDQVLAALDFARTLPFVDVSRWIVMGQSVGGFAAVTTVWRKPPGLIAGINFAGGVGGDPDRRPGRPCDPLGVERLWRSNASGTAPPMLWLYWQNDLYWGADVPKQWHIAWLEGGGRAEFNSLADAGKDGHGAIGFDMDHWVPIVDDFLARLGFAKPGSIARPPPSQ